MVIGLARVLRRRIVLALVVRDYFLKFRQKERALPAYHGTLALSSALRKSIALMCLRDEVAAILHEVLVLKLEVRVVRARSSLALYVGLLHYLVLIEHSKLMLVRCVGRGHNNLPSARVASFLVHQVLYAFLATIAQRVLPSVLLRLLVRIVIVLA